MIYSASSMAYINCESVAEDICYVSNEGESGGKLQLYVIHRENAKENVETACFRKLFFRQRVQF